METLNFRIQKLSCFSSPFSVILVIRTIICLQPSSVANIDEWRWKISLLLRDTEEQEIISRDKRDRRDYEQISNLAKRMGLYR